MFYWNPSLNIPEEDIRDLRVIFKVRHGNFIRFYNQSLKDGFAELNNLQPSQSYHIGVRLGPEFFAGSPGWSKLRHHAEYVISTAQQGMHYLYKIAIIA